MIPVGYIAKRVAQKPDWLLAEDVKDILSLSGCISEYFCDYINFWKHNGYWLFDSPEVIKRVASENKIDLSDMSFFYYEVYEKEYDENKKEWLDFQPESSFETSVQSPEMKTLQGYDVVSFWAGTSPECSPLSCNNLCSEISTNAHCLLESFDDAKTQLETGKFDNSEPGPFRIFAVYSIP